MSSSPALLWLRNDLRFDDNPAMSAALATGQPIVCVYIHDDVTPGEMRIGSAQRWWLHHALTSFGEELEKRGGALILRRGDPREIIPDIAEEIGTHHIFWNRRYMQWQTEVDCQVDEELSLSGRKVESHNGQLLFEPEEIKSGSGTPYRVFTPFWKAINSRHDVRAPLEPVQKLTAPETLPASDKLADWELLPTSPDWASKFNSHWRPGEARARNRLDLWLQYHADRYLDQRDLPAIEATSRLSPYLHFGEISPVRIWQTVKSRISAGEIREEQGEKFLSEIAWREFSAQLLYHQPQMTQAPLDEKFTRFTWDENKQNLRAWQKGLTGYPIVDAGMRELWQTGWMHNRVRMIVGSFLVKDLHLDWREGMAWFWDTLLDADPANNTANWQWIAGCGADAAPYFRIFNPTTQSQKFDPQGIYIRKYIPELANLPDKFIHDPSSAPSAVLKQAGVELGETYPSPIVDHKTAREEALARYQAIK